MLKIITFFYFVFATSCVYCSQTMIPEQVTFYNGKLELHGLLYKPKGQGPFPAVLYNHGSSPGMTSNQASAILGPLYAARGWVFFMPYRRGQGLSAAAGPYIMDEMKRAREQGGSKALTTTMIRLMTQDHLSDQLAALAWLKKEKYIRADQIAVAGNSFGGIQTVLGAAKGSYCAAIDASGGAQSWKDIPELRKIMIDAVQHSKAPIFFFQAANDYNISPSQVLSAVMKKSHKPYKITIYPPFGKTDEGHSFAYLGTATWAPDVFNFLKQHCLNK